MGVLTFLQSIFKPREQYVSAKLILHLSNTKEHVNNSFGPLGFGFTPEYVINEKKMRSLERIIGKKNIFLYKEYSIDDDKVTYKIDELDLNPYANVISGYIQLENSDGFDVGEMLTKAVETYRSMK